MLYGELVILSKGAFHFPTYNQLEPGPEAILLDGEVPVELLSHLGQPDLPLLLLHPPLVPLRLLPTSSAPQLSTVLPLVLLRLLLRFLLGNRRCLLLCKFSLMEKLYLRSLL